MTRRVLERRRFPRIDVSYAIEVKVDNCQSPELRGATLNMSRGGLLAHLDHPNLASGLRCEVRLLGTKGRVSPTLIRGTTCRIEGRWGEGSMISIEFDTPLVILEAAGVPFTLADNLDSRHRVTPLV